MDFQVTSTNTHAVDSDRPAETGSQSILAKAGQQAVGVVRRMGSIYIGFSLNTLNVGLRNFAMLPQEGAATPSLDQQAFYKNIFDQVRHHVSGNQAALEADLLRMKEVLDAGVTRAESAREGGHAHNPADAGSGGSSSAGSAADAQAQTRPERDHGPARHHHRHYAETGRNNALALLGGHGGPNHPAHMEGHEGSQAASQAMAEILEQFKRLREERQSDDSRPSRRTHNDDE